MDMPEITVFLHKLCDVAELETMPRFRNLAGVDNKFDGGFDPVTEADREAERKIREMITAHHPDHGIIGEEFGESNPEAEFCWVIDPVDGTRAFIAGIPVWGTLIGLFHHGKPLAGIMHQPFTGERYISDGSSSFLHFKGQLIDLKSSDEQDLAKSILMTTAPEIFDEASMQKFQSLTQSVRMTRYGADCYAYCQVASGQVGLVVEAGLQIYDVGALIPIIENAGGKFTDWEGNSVTHGGRVIAAANEAVHSSALEILNR